MKNRIIALFSIVILSLTFTSCDIKNPVDGVELRVKTLARNTVVSFSIFDAATNNLIKPETVNVKYLGDDGDKIITMINEPISESNTTTGIINFAISDDIIPTPENPVELTVVVTVDGYVSSSSQIFISSPGASAHSISMASVTNTPNGVVSSETKGTSDNGGTTSEIVASSGTEPNSGAAATITIPQGTVLKDGNGNVLTGEVKARVTYFNPKDEESLNSFPGGFSVTSGGERGSFVSAGFTAVDMTVNGKKVEQFGSGVGISVEVPSDVINPNTGAPIQPGEKIPLWSYDEETGKWTREGEVAIPASLNKSANGKSVYKVSTTIHHLSYWNLDWFQDACYEGIKINVIGGCYPYLKIKGKRKSDGAYFYSGYISGNDRIIQLYNAPRDVPVTVELWDYSVYPQVLVAVMDIDNLCGTDVDFPIENSNNMVEVTATASAVCHNSDGTVKSRFYPNNYPIYVRRPTNQNWIYLGQVIDGQISACLELGVTYTFGTYIDGYWLEYPYTITQSDYDLIFSDLDYPNEMRDFCN